MMMMIAIAMLIGYSSCLRLWVAKNYPLHGVHEKKKREGRPSMSTNRRSNISDYNRIDKTTSHAVYIH